MKTNDIVSRRLCRVAKLIELAAAESRPNLIFRSDPSECGGVIADELSEAAAFISHILIDAANTLADAEGGLQ